MRDPLFVLGAADPEMNAIEHVLSGVAVPFVHASIDGKRVHPANAYRAHAPPAALTTSRRGGRVYLVECVDDTPHGAVRIDHHQPGHPGYGKPPAEYWQASSLGQTVAVLAGMTTAPLIVTPEMRMIAAADHCLGAAYQGECPGIDPGALLDWHVAARAAFQRRSAAAVMQDAEAARTALAQAPRIALAAGVFAADMRERPVAELPLAAARDGQCCLSTVKTRDGRTKVGCLVGTPVQIEAFLHTWAPAQRLIDLYGDPARGFAGAYVPQDLAGR